MKFLSQISTALLPAIIALSATSCTTARHRTDEQIPQSTQSLSTEGTIRIGSWNLQRFGRTKASRPHTMLVIANEIRKYDLIALQEIKDIRGDAWTHLLNEVNRNSDLYGGIISPVAGERYGFIYRKDRIRVKDFIHLPEGLASKFSYPPYSAYFEVMGGTFSFIAVNIHTRPSRARQEIALLPSLAQRFFATPELKDERDLLVLGDLNADCTYFDESNKEVTEHAGLKWIISDDESTNVAGGCTYDRMLISAGMKSDFTGIAGVSPLDRKLFFLGGHQVSDHLPIYGIFFTSRDRD